MRPSDRDHMPISLDLQEPWSQLKLTRQLNVHGATASLQSEHDDAAMNAARNHPWRSFQQADASWLSPLSPGELSKREGAMAERRARKRQIHELRAARASVHGLTAEARATVQVRAPPPPQLGAFAVWRLNKFVVRRCRVVSMNNVV